MCFLAFLDRYSCIIHALYYYLGVHCIIFSFRCVKLESNRHLFVDVVLIMRQKLNYFYIALYIIAVTGGNSLSGAPRIVCNVQWQGLSYSQKVDLSVVCFSPLSHDENVKISSRVQQFIIEF